MIRRLWWRIVGRPVDVLAVEVVAFAPDNPPSRGSIVLVDGVRSQVTRCRKRWGAGGRYEILELRVKAAPK